jgi:hypothetical protein
MKTNKSDYIGADAIAEAVGRPRMRFVPIKTNDQLDLPPLHRVRERWLMRGTAVINQVRGFLLERGLTLRKGRCHLDTVLPGTLENDDARPSGALHVLLAQLKLEPLSSGNTNRRSRCGNQEDSGRERSLPTAGNDPWYRTGDGDRSPSRDRKRSRLSQGAGVRRLARDGPGTTYNRK